jgi:hypothetical protein
MLLERRLDSSWVAGFDDNQMSTVTRSYCHKLVRTFVMIIFSSLNSVPYMTKISILSLYTKYDAI